MTDPSLPAKDKKSGPLAPMVGLAVFVLIGVAVTGVMEQRSLQTNGSVSSSAILGEWRTADSSSRILFRADKTLGMGLGGSPDAAALEPGAYQLESAGTVSIKMNDGRSFTATFREFTPNQFDLVDSVNQGVKVFVKTP